MLLGRFGTCVSGVSGYACDVFRVVLSGALEVNKLLEAENKHICIQLTSNRYDTSECLLAKRIEP